MKDIYEAPVMDVIFLASADIICASPITGDDEADII